MRIWRVCGWLLVALGVLVLGMDMLQSLEDGRFHILSLAEHWASLAPAGYQAFWGEEEMRGILHAVLAVVLRLPGFAPFMIGGLILVFANPQRRRGIFRR
ncbi:MAG: hypothetical protein D6782_11970 [Alphaproteobacteria bacterium]|nr:MAG: hypothetical protein D6782_11970 [Alphaproteobacteria bacterium]